MLSQQRWGGQAEDYLPIHEFIDSTKVLCADNRQTSDGRMVPVKEMVERDHFLPDYRHRFIPTLNDFVNAISEEDLVDVRQSLEAFHAEHTDTELSQLLLSPLAVTGKLKSLLITHNSWFINTIVPKLLDRSPAVIDFNLTPNDLFDRMQFAAWMDNGLELAPSAKALGIHKQLV